MYFENVCIFLLIRCSIILQTTTKFNWSQEQQGWIFSAYFVGYFVSHIPGALLAQKFGGKWIFACEILIILICNALIPSALVYGIDI